MVYDKKIFEVKNLVNKYILFKDDDVGKNFNNLKKWIDIIIENNAKAAIGLIGKYMKNKELVEYLNSLDPTKIEIFCHGYYHSYLPFIINKLFKNKRTLGVEFDKDNKSHNKYLKKYRLLEKKYLKIKAISFGPPGNIWNNSVIDALINNDFKMMFSWEKIKGNIFTIPLTNNLKQDSFEKFLEEYKSNKNEIIYTLQFHHADLSYKQFEIIKKVINFLKHEEKRIFITPSELLEISKKDREISNLIH